MTEIAAAAVGYAIIDTSVVLVIVLTHDQQ